MFVENLKIIKCLSVFYIIKYNTRKIALSETDQMFVGLLYYKV